MPHSLPLSLSLPAPSPSAAFAPPPAPARAQGALWAAIHLPALPLEALGMSAASSRVLAIVEEETPRAPVLALSAGAREAGIRPGMSAAAAAAHSADLAFHRRDPARETAMLERLAHWGGDFTPALSLEPPAALLLDVGASLRLFGGIGKLRARMRSGLDALGLTASLAFAPTPRAALWLARADARVTAQRAEDLPGALGVLPLAVLNPEAQIARKFLRLGVQTLAQAFRLPRDGLARRFGPELIRDWDRALGWSPEVRRHYHAAPRFAIERELPGACDTSGELLPILDELLGALVLALRERDAGIASFALIFRHDDLPDTRIVLRLFTPSRERARLERLLRIRLETLVLAAPVVAIGIASGVFLPIANPKTELLSDPTKEAQAMDPLIEILHARLGGEAVFGLAFAADPRPERAWRKSRPGAKSAPPPAAAGPRPLWLFARPRPLSAREGIPWHTNRPLALASGPERIEAGWWEGGDVGRDYYLARSDAGARLWIYRDHRDGGAWFLHGCFS